MFYGYDDYDVCPMCGEELDSDTHFCTTCGEYVEPISLAEYEEGEY